MLRKGDISMGISEYIVCFIVGFIVFGIIWEAGDYVNQRKWKRKWEKDRAKLDKKIKAEYDAREQEKKLTIKRVEAEADKLVSKFNRSELTELIIKEATATDGTVVEIHVSGSEVMFMVMPEGENLKFKAKTRWMYYRDYGFESLEEIKSQALAKAIAQKLGSDYEYAGQRDRNWLVRYRHMDKLEPKLRSPI